MKHLGSKTLETDRLIIKKDNIASKKVMEKCDMELEGIKRKSYYKEGIFYDNYLFSKIKEDYK